MLQYSIAWSEGLPIKKRSTGRLQSCFTLEEEAFFAKGGRDERLKLFPPSLYCLYTHSLYTHSLGGSNKRLKLLSNPLYPTWIHAT